MNRGVETAQTIAPVNEGKLRDQYQSQQHEDYFLPTLHRFTLSLQVSRACLSRRSALAVFNFAALQSSRKRPLIFIREVNRGDVLADIAPEVCDQYVFGMNRIGVERGAVWKDGDQSRMVGAREMKHIEADIETLYTADDAGQMTKARDVLVANRLLDIGLIFPDDYMSEHFYAV